MADIDLTLKWTNPALWDQLKDYTTKSHNVVLNLQYDIQKLKQDLMASNMTIPVEISPAINRTAITTLKQQIEAGLGTVNLNIQIGNLALLNNQIQQLLSAFGGNMPTVNPQNQQQSTNFALAREEARSIRMGRITPVQLGLASQQGLSSAINDVRGNVAGDSSLNISARNIDYALMEAPAQRALRLAPTLVRQSKAGQVDPALNTVYQELQMLSGQFAGTDMGIKIDEALRQIGTAQMAGAKPARQASTQLPFKNQAQMSVGAFQQDRLIDKTTSSFLKENLTTIALLGPEKAARKYEDERGLNLGAIDRSRLPKRMSFDLGRAFEPEAFNELAFAGMFGGPAGLLGGLAGGGTFGRPGVFLGSAIFQGVFGAIEDNFKKIAGTLMDAAKAGLELQQSIAGLASSFTTSSTVFDRNTGQQANEADSFKFQQNRAKNIVKSARIPLGQLGLGVRQQGAVLSSLAGGASEAGFNLADGDIVKLSQPIIAQILATNPEVLSSPRLQNSIRDLLTGTLKPNSEIFPAFKSIQPQLKQAIATGDTDALVRAFDRFLPLIKALAESTDNASPAVSRLINTFDTLKSSFGDNFAKELIPAFNQLTKTFSDPKLIDAVERSGKSVGKSLGGLIMWLDRLAEKAGVFKPENIEKQTKVATGALRGDFRPALNALPPTDKIFQTRGTESATLEGLKLGANIYNMVPEELQQYLPILLGPQGGLKAAENIKNRREAVKTGSGMIKPSNIRGTKSGIEAEPNDPVLRMTNDELLNVILGNIDQGTPQGKFDAEMERLDFASMKSVKEGGISQGVFDAQSARLKQNFNLDEQLKDVNQQSFAGKFQAGAIGLEKQVIAGTLSAGVANQQTSSMRTDISGQVVQSFLDLNKVLIDTTKSLASLEMKSKELTAQSELLKVAMSNQENAEKIRSLTGAAKLEAMGQQILDKGGTLPIVPGTFQSEIGGFSLSNLTPSDNFGEIKTPQQRREIEILQKQFENEARLNTGDAKTNQNIVDRVGLNNKALDLEAQQDFLPFEKLQANVNLARSVTGFARDNQLDESGLEKIAPGLGDAFKKSKAMLEDGASNLTGKNLDSLQGPVVQGVNKLVKALEDLSNNLEGKIKNAVNAITD